MLENFSTNNIYRQLLPAFLSIFCFLPASPSSGESSSWTMYSRFLDTTGRYLLIWDIYVVSEMCQFYGTIKQYNPQLTMCITAQLENANVFLLVLDLLWNRLTFCTQKTFWHILSSWACCPKNLIGHLNTTWFYFNSIACSVAPSTWNSKRSHQIVNGTLITVDR